MVRTSMRKHMITSIQNAIEDDIVLLAVNMALDDNYYSEEESDEELNEVVSTLNQIEDKARALVSIQLHRYLKPRVPIEKAPHISDFLLHRLDDKRFKQEFRMRREPFLNLCDLIRTNQVFENNANNLQCLVEEQMMVIVRVRVQGFKLTLSPIQIYLDSKPLSSF